MSLRSALVFLVALSIAAPSAAAIKSQEELNRTVDAFFQAPAIDEAHVYQVQDLVIYKDIATFTLKEGTLYLTKPIEGVLTSAVFIGRGTASIKPSRQMDKEILDLTAQEHLKKKPGGQINTNLTEMFLVSFDGSLADLSKSLTIKSTSSDLQRAANVLKDRIDVIKSQELSFDLTLAEKIAGFEDGPFYVDFQSADYGWLVFSYVPRDQYELRLASREKVGMFYLPRWLLVTHKSADLDENGKYVADAVKDQKPYLDIKRYKMEITIPDTNHFLVEADVTLAPLIDNLPVLEFDLVNNIAGSKSTQKAKPIYLNKVTDDSGNEVPFIHRKNTVLVLPSEPLKLGTDYTFHFSLDEQTIIQLSSVHYWVLNTYPWYPKHGYLGGQAAMDWTIKAKKPLYATGSGRIVKEESDRIYNVTQLVFDRDVTFPSLIFGQYQKLVDAYKTDQGGADVELAVFSWPKATFYVIDEELPQPLSVDVTVPGGKPKDVLQEAKEIIKFCENLYGPFPYEQLQVAQMSPGLGFGQAPPGFVQLTGEAFMSSAELANFTRINADFFHEFFSHEIAHQWWGHVIQWASDEDVWLSESFAEYTAGLYTMQLLGQDRFQGKMKQWKDNARIGDPHAPIAWANNVSGPNAGRWRTGLIYDKGPYVVHMLRMQVGHENFVKAMKNLTSKYRYQQITTDQLRQEVEAVVGYKLDYFFDQWYRDTGIPTFDYSTNVRQTEDGKWLATVNISQRDKQNFKIVSMPVFFHFGKDKVIVKDRPVLKADDVYQVKLPEKPERITLDDFHTLLADIVQQGASAQ